MNQGCGSYGGRFFAISENALIVSNQRGILLYRIPNLRAGSHDPYLDPEFFWSGDASDLRGTLYKTASPYPALWLQGGSTTHTLEFDVDESNCFPVVTNHRIAGGRPAFCSAEYTKLHGRKGMSIEGRLRGEILFHTGTLEDPNLTRRLHASIPGLNDNPSWDEFKYVDLDELTGRIMIVVGPKIGWGQNDFPYSRRLFIADLPA
jgi:hypothetical protein